MHKLSRRKFLYTSSGVAAGAFLIPGIADAEISLENKVSKSGLLTGEAKPLKYSAIPGFLSAEQLAPHYSAHYGGALRGYIAADKKLQSSIISATTIDSNAYGSLQRSRANKANSVLLHELYFDGMSLIASDPNAEIRVAIEKRFGSIDKWAVDFQASAKAASGWAVLAVNSVNGKLYNIVCDKHAAGLLWMSTPLLALDVYEHAYYVDYKNNKAEYITKFMGHIDWAEINHRYKKLS